jgi:thiol-disulfide isomerase/thioredoxin
MGWISGLRSAMGMAAGIWLLFVAPVVAAGTPGEVMVGEQLREAQMNGIAGPGARLSSFRGKPLLINVWASWCGPCRAEIASLDRLARRYNGREFNVIGISTDDDAAAAAAFVRQYGISFANYIDHKLLLENMLGADRLPMTLLIDADGRVIKKIAGSRSWDSPEAVNLITQAFRLKTR